MGKGDLGSRLKESPAFPTRSESRLGTGSEKGVARCQAGTPEEKGEASSQAGSLRNKGTLHCEVDDVSVGRFLYEEDEFGLLQPLHRSCDLVK